MDLFTNKKNSVRYINFTSYFLTFILSSIGSIMTYMKLVKPVVSDEIIPNEGQIKYKHISALRDSNTKNMRGSAMVLDENEWPGLNEGIWDPNNN